MVEKPLAPGSTIGILGGGQLGRMLAAAAGRLGLKSHIFCPEAGAPAFDLAAAKTIAPYDNTAALTEFASAIDVATFEFENIPIAALRQIEATCRVFPDEHSLAISQDRLSEKTYLHSLSLPVGAFVNVQTQEDLVRAATEIGRPAMLKTRKLGYDGKGQVKIDNDTDLSDAFDAIGRVP
ncbi:MAG: ATP-grasp domain-containing protein, partial [Methyloligellaceae bacterium]